MNVPIKLIRKFLSGQAVVVAASVAAIAALLFAAIGIISQIDIDQLRLIWAQGRSEPQRVFAGIAGFSLAFGLRSAIWSSALSGLSVRQSWAAIHVALGANHILPFRLGEPLRVISAIRRTDVSVAEATASTIALRTSDIATLLLIGLALGPNAMLDALTSTTSNWSLVVLGCVVLFCIVGLLAVCNQFGIDLRSNLPRPHLVILSGSAWLLEAVLIWQVAQLSSIDLSYADSVLVTSIAVSAQMIAIAPGGVGTYEAAATAGLALVGIDPRLGLGVALTTHLLKTLYSLLTGAIAMALPRPSLIGHLRVPRSITPRAVSTQPTTSRPNTSQLTRSSVAQDSTDPGSEEIRPIVLFMPAYQEGPRIAEVIGRTPKQVAGRPIVNLVIDDGSTDNTATAAAAAGAHVVSLGSNHGLGAAVAAGFEHALSDFDAEVVVFCDADGEYDPADIGDLVGPVLNGDADYIIGSRFAGEIEHMRPHRRAGNLALTRWVSWVTRTKISDGQSGYRALSAEAAAAVEMPHDYNYAQVLTIDLIMKGFRYLEVPITYKFRESGDSFVKLGVYLRTVMPTVWRQLNPR